LREIDRRVRFLRKRLDVLQVVETTPKDLSKVFFGAWVELESEDGETVKYRIVGPDEFDVSKGYISMDAPLAKALMRKAEGDDVCVSLPKGEKTYEIIEVYYQQGES